MPVQPFQTKEDKGYTTYMPVLVLKGLAKDKISVGCEGCDWKKAGIY